MMSKLHVLIVGGGIGGLASAIAIAAAGHRATVLEAQEEFSEATSPPSPPPLVT